MFVGGKWRLLRCSVVITFLAICLFAFYIPRITTIPTNQDIQVEVNYKGRCSTEGLLIVSEKLDILLEGTTIRRRQANLHELEVAGWEFNVTRDVTQYINTTHDTTLISGKEICEGPNAYTVIIVTSAPSNFVVRTAIRETWAAHNISNLRVGFLLGLTNNVTVQSAIEEESAEFKDIIQDAFHDSYNNLTIKSVVLLKWFINHCTQTVFLMKADDDTYVNVKTLSTRLMLLPRHSVLMGTLICKAKPIEKASSKWYSPKYMYHQQFYPDYLSGTAYVMSRDVATKVYAAALTTPIFYLEDIYITGICAKRVGIRPKQFQGFTYSHFDISKCYPNLITNHRIKPEGFRTLWAQRDNCTDVMATKPPLRKATFNPCY